MSVDKELVRTMSNVKQLTFETQEDEKCILLYNQTQLSEEEAREILYQGELEHPKVCVMTQEQFENVFSDKEEVVKEPEKKSKKKPDKQKEKRQSFLEEYEEYKEFRRFKKMRQMAEEEQL